MREPARTAAVTLATAACAAFLAAVTGALAHGASRGLHLHLLPESAPPGAEVEVAMDAALPIARARVSFVGQKALEVKPHIPAKRVVVKLTLPAGTRGAVINVQAEVETTSGKTFRAAAILKVTPAPP